MTEDNYYQGNLKSIVRDFISRKDKFLSLSKKYKTPMYVYDSKLHQSSIDTFKIVFKKYIPNLEIYYAMKLNHHPYMIKKAVKNGFGIEVSSIRELKIARKYKAKNISYYAPGKTSDDLKYIINNSNKLVLNIDSFNELKKIEKITTQLKKDISVGVRINLMIHGSWNKYGIPLIELKKFWIEANKREFIHIQGIHFHTSRNKNSTIYVKSIKKIGLYLKKYFNEKMLKQIKYLDFGGGYDTNLKEGVYPWETKQGKIKTLVENKPYTKIKFKDKYLLLKNSSLDKYANDIGKAIDKYIRPIVNISYITEPGRILCNDGMHILVKIVDIKSRNKIIVDGGVNLVGWQRFEHEYFPIINLTHPASTEKKCVVYGNLCTTWDLWGFYIYTKKLTEGDLLIIPYQGALTYTLAQNFINPIAKVYKI